MSVFGCKVSKNPSILRFLILIKVWRVWFFFFWRVFRTLSMIQRYSGAILHINITIFYLNFTATPFKMRFFVLFCLELTKKTQKTDEKSQKAPLWVNRAPVFNGKQAQARQKKKWDEHERAQKSTNLRRSPPKSKKKYIKRVKTHGYQSVLWMKKRSKKSENSQ